MTVRLRLATLAAACCLIGASAQRPGFTLAIVRHDGRLIPFAAFSDGRWMPAWPEPSDDPGATRSLDEVSSVWQRRGEAVPRTWFVWPSTSGAVTRTRVRDLDIVGTHCEKQPALATDLPAQREQLAKRGVAADVELPIAPVVPVGRMDALWREALQVVRATFDRLEAAAPEGERPRAPREIPTPTVTLEQLYRERDRARSPLYFVAQRKYVTGSNPGDAGCALTTVLAGWLLRDTYGKWILADHHVFLTDCDRKSAVTAMPVAALRLDDRQIWILDERAYEGEAFAIAEIGADRVRYPLRARAGGC